jgi:hypothetical protein
MTRLGTFFTFTAAATLGATGALAQEATQTPPASTAPEAAAPAPDATAQTSFSDGDVDQFASAAIAVQNIQKDTAVPDADKQTKMASAVTSSGLTAEKFNAIAQASQSDPALMKRIQTAAATKMQGSAAAAPAAPESPPQ